MLEEFQLVGKDLFDQGLVDSHGGNLSVRQGDKIFITRRGAMLGHLKEGDIIEVGIEENNDKDKEASREIITHRAIYKSTPAQAIVHAHPISAIALSLVEEKIIPQDAEGKYYLKSIPVVRVTRDSIGSEEVAKLLPSIFNSSYVIAIVKAHGSFAIGKTLEEAYMFTSCFEGSCKVLSALKVLGRRSMPEKGIPDRVDRGRAIPPGLGVMDRQRYRQKGLQPPR